MISEKTTVVNVKRDEFDVYIGRAMPNFSASAFANPFRVGADGDRAQVLAKYRGHLLCSPALLVQLPTLRGKRLGCWCKPLDCHGDILAELLGDTPAVQGPEAADTVLSTSYSSENDREVVL